MIMQIDRMVRRIGAVLKGDAEGFEARALASDYAAHIERTRERLRQCAALVHAGNDAAALQVAESNPPVLDIAAKLSFGESAHWRAWCKDAGLPCPPPLEDHLVELVNTLYSKEISESHPLYRDYRAAIREHDEIRALAVLRSITRISAKDANARTEYDRLAAKVRRELLAKLREAFAHHRNEEAFGIMSQLETSGLGPCEDNADWRDAAHARDEWEKRKMLGEAVILVPEICKHMDRGEWEACMPLIGKVQALRHQYGFNLPPQEAKLLAHAETWVQGHAAVADKVRRERLVIDELVGRLDALEKRAAEPRRADIEIAADIQSLDTWLTEAVAAPETSHLEKPTRYAKELRSRLAAEQRRRRARRLAGGATLATVTLALAGGACWFTFDTLEQREFIARLTAAESEKLQKPVQAFLAGPAKNAGRHAAEADHAFRIEVLRRRCAEADKSLLDILSGARAHASDKPAPPGTPPLATLESLAEKLPLDLRDEAEAALEPARKAAANREADRREASASAFGSAKAALEAVLANPSPDPAARAAAEARLKTALLDPLVPETDIAAARALLKQVAATSMLRDAVSRYHAAVAAAKTLDDHLLAAATAAIITGDPEPLAPARRINAASDALRALPLALLPKEAAGTAKSLRNASGFAIPAPDALEASDATKFVAEAAKYTDLYRVPSTRYEADGSRSITYLCKGRPTTESFDLAGGIEIRAKGERLKAGGTFEPFSITFRQFEGKNATGEQLSQAAKAPESELLSYCAKLFDSDRNTFLDSPLALIDRVYAAKTASPLLRAHLILTLGSLLELRPDARGLDCSPEFRAELAKLRAAVPVPPGWLAWITPERHLELAPALRAYFETKRPAFTPIARFRLKLIQGVLGAGTRCVGACDAEGTPRLASPPPPSGTRLMGLDTLGNPAVLGIVGANGTVESAKPATPWSPLLILAATPASIAETLECPDRPEPPAGDWTNLFLPAP